MDVKARQTFYYGIDDAFAASPDPASDGFGLLHRFTDRASW